jgi:hypothetical protein
VAHRSIVCKLDARMANPDERAFDFDPVDEVRRDRAALVMAALTVLRAYRAMGAPPAKLKPFGGFDDFDLIREFSVRPRGWFAIIPLRAGAGIGTYPTLDGVVDLPSLSGTDAEISRAWSCRAGGRDHD